MRIERLYGRYARQALLVLGTGPSVRVFPPRLLWRSGPVLLLNQAWRYVPEGHYGDLLALTVHPELVLQFEAEAPPWLRGRVAWAVKKKPPLESLGLDDPRYFVFHTTTDLKAIAERPADTLYLGEGIQCTAIDLAARTGAEAVLFAGCDACSLNGEHHAHDQHVRFLGQKPDDQYALYRKRTAQARRAAREAWGLDFATLSPFVGSGHPGEDYARLCKEHGLPPLPAPKDVSPYTRKAPPQ